MADPAFQIDLPVRAVVCSTHGELFRLNWPAGYIIFSVHAAHTVLRENEEIRDLTGEDAGQLNAIIAEFGPLCRLLTPEQRRASYIEAKSPNWGERGVCAGCHKWKLGARGLYRTPARDDHTPRLYRLRLPLAMPVTSRQTYEASVRGSLGDRVADQGVAACLSSSTRRAAAPLQANGWRAVALAALYPLRVVAEMTRHG